MANFSKYKSYGVGHLLKHNNRKKGDGVRHSNEDIDDNRTGLNYHLKYGTVDDVQNRLNQLFYMKRKDMTILGEMVVTLPKDVKKTDEDMRKFFKAVYDFYSEDLGEENIINAVVHRDETTPHIHIDFLPVVKGNIDFEKQFGVRGRMALEMWMLKNPDRELERLCCYEKINQKYLDTMHPRLAAFVKERMGYEVSILNEATIEGNKTVLKLKADDLKGKVGSLENDFKAVLTLGKKYGINENDRDVLPLMYRISDLEKKNKVLEGIIARQGYRYTSEELEVLRNKKYAPAKSAYVNVFQGSLVDASIENDAAIVIELYDKIERKSPQQSLIDSDDDLFRQTRLVQNSSVKVMWRNSRTSSRMYLFIKTDSPKETMENLLLFEERLLEEQSLRSKKLYMDKIETDSYDLARIILQKNHINAQYYVSLQTLERETEKEKSQEKQKD